MTSCSAPLTEALVFALIVIGLTFATALLPLPGDVVPVIVVSFPALVATGLRTLEPARIDTQPREAQRALWSFKPTWIVVAFGLAFAGRLLVSAAALGLGLISAIQIRPLAAGEFAFLAFVLIVFAAPEEFGWRGYALPRLLRAFSPLGAGLVIGLFWGVVHLALHLPGMINAGQPLVPVVIAVTGISVVVTWLFVRTGGNLLVVTVYHGGQNFFVVVNEGIGQPEQLWLMAAVSSVLALIIAIGAGPGFREQPARIGKGCA